MNGFYHIKNNQLEYNMCECHIILVHIMDYAVSNSSNKYKILRNKLRRNIHDLYKENV